MPVEDCKIDGKPGYKWGEQGACYPYEPDNDESRERAKAKALEQGRAIEASKHRREGYRITGEREWSLKATTGCGLLL